MDSSEGWSRVRHPDKVLKPRRDDTHVTCPIHDIPDHDPSSADENSSDWKSIVSASAKLLLCGVRDSADAFGPLKAVAGGLCFILENCEVSSHLSHTVRTAYKCRSEPRQQTADHVQWAGIRKIATRQYRDQGWSARDKNAWFVPRLSTSPWLEVKPPY